MEDVHNGGAIEGHEPHSWRWAIISLVILLAVVAAFMIWAGVSDASAAGGCGGG